MARKKDKPEHGVLKLRQVEMLRGQGKGIAEAVRQIGVTQQTYHRWRKPYGSKSRDQPNRLKELKTENTRLGRAVSDLTLDKMILIEAAPGNPLVAPRCHIPLEIKVAGRRLTGLVGQVFCARD
jgi:transposase-like protein